MLLAVGLALFLAGCTVNKKANMFRAGLQRIGGYGSFAVDQLRWLKWKFKTDGWFRSSHVVADHVIYTLGAMIVICMLKMTESLVFNHI